MREEIVAGLKNAMARGTSLEQAVQSFINAGYNSSEVSEAANFLSNSAMNIANPAVKSPALSLLPKISAPIPPPQSAIGSPIQPSPSSPDMHNPYNLMHSVQDKNTLEAKKRKKRLIVALSAALLVILIGIVVVIMMKDKIGNLFG